MIGVLITRTSLVLTSTPVWITTTRSATPILMHTTINSLKPSMPISTAARPLVRRLRVLRMLICMHRRTGGQRYASQRMAAPHCTCVTSATASRSSLSYSGLNKNYIFLRTGDWPKVQLPVCILGYFPPKNSRKELFCMGTFEINKSQMR